MKFSLALLAAALASTVVCDATATEEASEEVFIPEDAINLIIPVADDEFPMVAKYGDLQAILVVNGTTLELSKNDLSKRDAEARPFGFRWTRYGWFEPLAKRDEGADAGLAKRDADAEARAFGFRWTRYGWFEPLAKRDDSGLAKRDADARPFGFRWTRYGWFEPLAQALGLEDF